MYLQVCKETQCQLEPKRRLGHLLGDCTPPSKCPMWSKSLPWSNSQRFGLGSQALETLTNSKVKDQTDQTYLGQTEGDLQDATSLCGQGTTVARTSSPLQRWCQTSSPTCRMKGVPNRYGTERRSATHCHTCVQEGRKVNHWGVWCSWTSTILTILFSTKNASWLLVEHCKSWLLKSRQQCNTRTSMFGGGITAIKTCACLLWTWVRYIFTLMRKYCAKVAYVGWKRLGSAAPHLQVLGPANPGDFWIHAQRTIGLNLQSLVLGVSWPQMPAGNALKFNMNAFWPAMNGHWVQYLAVKNGFFVSNGFYIRVLYTVYCNTSNKEYEQHLLGLTFAKNETYRQSDHVLFIVCTTRSVVIWNWDLQQ